MPTKLRNLKNKAIEACESHGHVMQRFYRGPYSIALGVKRTYHSQCLRCNKGVTVHLKPMPNEIDIGGEAVALNCEAPWHSDFISLACLWHGGQKTALYTFACNHGIIYTERGADNLITEIEECLTKTKKPRYIEELKLFRQYVKEKKLEFQVKHVIGDRFS